MSTVNERFAKHFFNGDDWTLTHAQIKDVEAFFHQELMQLAEEVEKYEGAARKAHKSGILGTSHAEGEIAGVQLIVSLIRAKAAELIV